MRILLASAAIAALAQPGLAAETAADAALQAAADLRAAIGALEAARSGKDRVAALTRTIQAYELGQTALRDGMRRAAIREREIAASFEARRARLGQVLGAMTAIERSAGPLVLLHPDGPRATVETGLLLSAVAPALQAEAERLRAELQEQKDLREARSTAAATLQAGMVAAQEARTALSQAMQDRTGLPRRFLEDPEELRALHDSAGSLEAFAAGLAAMESDVGPPAPGFAEARGTLALPVQGRLLRRSGETDAAGIARPGILIATRPQALVTAPWTGTIRYRGPLLDYGNVMILEPEAGYLLVLAGLGTVYGETGDIVDMGAPLGLMGGRAEGDDDPLAQETGGAGRTETLYIEIRRGEQPVDPAEWFAGTRD